MIQFEHVSKRYKAQSAPALDDISLEIAEGEFTFLVGPSGSGKSTFLRLLLREERPLPARSLSMAKTSQNAQLKVPAFRRGMGAVFQDFRLLPEKTVTQNVAFALEVIGAPKSAVGPAVADALELVGLTEMADRKPGQLSGGEQQRVALARAFVNKPPILIADEPTGNLDPATSLGIMRLLDRINRTGTTVIMATHDAAIVDQMRKRVIELVGGYIIRDEARGVYGYAGRATHAQIWIGTSRSWPWSSSEPDNDHRRDPDGGGITDTFWYRADGSVAGRCDEGLLVRPR